MSTPDALFESNLPGLELLGRGKVRDIYAVDDDHLLIVTSDRLSAYDVVMPDPIPGKGRVLTQISLFWFDMMADLVPNQLTGLTVDDIKKFVVHQSNIRIIDAARERLGMNDDKVYVNIDRFGNSSAGSAGLCLDQLWQAGEIERGDTIMLVAFGGGLTWASSVWRV